MRFLFFSILLAAGCGDDCPSEITNHDSCSNSGASCKTDSFRCECDGVWYCVDKACPDTFFPTGGCSPSGLSCNYGFEDSCECDNGQWVCHGGVRFLDLAVPIDASHAD